MSEKNADPVRRPWRPWPDSLWGRLAWVLVLGMLAAQALTSSIWFDLRYRHAMEMPIRLVSVHLADTLRVIEGLAPDDLPATLDRLDTETFRLKPVTGPLPQTQGDDEDALQAVQDILNQSLSDRLGRDMHARVLSAELEDDAGRPADLWGLLTAREPVGRFRLAVPLPEEGRWLDVTASEAQGGIEAEPLGMILDYLLRIYVLRIMVVVVIALLAVRLLLRPLRRLAAAAERLGEDLHSPPLPESGPREVRQAAGTFNLMQRRLIADIGARTRFLAAVSHDLRTPITRLRLRTEMLPAGELQQKFRKDLLEMESMVTSTLDYLRGDEQAEARQPVDVNALLQGLCADLEEAGGKVSLQGRAHAPIAAYAISLRRCLQNLLENALRYGRDASIHVEDDAHRLIVRVQDAGPGIPDASLEQVFEPFYRLDASRNPQTGGAGLGLSIARSVAQGHGGSLVLRNRAQGGLEAVLTLPRPPGASRR